MDLSNHHDTNSKREENGDGVEPGEVLITFRVKTSVEKESMNKYFWYLKTSMDGKRL
jgi:hypothetical protein